MRQSRGDTYAGCTQCQPATLKVVHNAGPTPPPVGPVPVLWQDLRVFHALLGGVLLLAASGAPGVEAHVVVLRLDVAPPVTLDGLHVLDTAAVEMLRQQLPGVRVSAPGVAVTTLSSDGEAQLRAMLEDPNALVDVGVLGALHASHLVLRRVGPGPSPVFSVRVFSVATGGDVARVEETLTQVDVAALRSAQDRLVHALLTSAGWTTAPTAGPSVSLPPPDPSRAAPSRPVWPLVTAGALLALAAPPALLAVLGAAGGAVFWVALFQPGLARVLVPRFLPQGPRFAARVVTPLASHAVAAALGVLAVMLMGTAGAASGYWMRLEDGT